MNIQKNSGIPLNQWRKLVNDSPYSSPFQSPEFFSLFNSIPNSYANAIAISHLGHVQALAVVVIFEEKGVRGNFTERGIIYGGPILSDQYPEVNKELISQLTKFNSKRSIYLESRNLSNTACADQFFRNGGWQYLPYTNFHIDTSDRANMLSSISKSRLRQIRNATKSGVIWKEATTIEQVRSFYSILFRLYKTKIKKPILPWEFFSETFHRKLAKYLLIWYNDEIIGGILCPILKDTCIYEFYICGLDTEFKKQYPSVMATWAALEFATINKIPKFDFMGAGLIHKDYGVRDFKERFGGEFLEYGRYRKIYKPLLYGIGKMVINIKNNS